MVDRALEAKVTIDDEFRIRIWDDNGLYYDNKADLPDEDYGGTELGGGSIVVHKAK